MLKSSLVWGTACHAPTDLGSRECRGLARRTLNPTKNRSLGLIIWIVFNTGLTYAQYIGLNLTVSLLNSCFEQRKPEAFAFFEVEGGDLFGEVADFGDVAGALGDRDDAACI